MRRSSFDVLRAGELSVSAASFLEQAYRTQATVLTAYLRRLARSAHALELAQESVVSDMLQEVFARALAVSARSLENPWRNSDAYLTTIARNCFVDALRVRKREIPNAPIEVGRRLANVAADPEVLDGDRVLFFLEDYLRTLGPEMGALYEQRYVRGSSQQQASSALGLSRRSVRTAEARFKRGLRIALLKSGISLGDVNLSVASRQRFRGQNRRHPVVYLRRKTAPSEHQGEGELHEPSGDTMEY